MDRVTPPRSAGRRRAIAVGSFVVSLAAACGSTDAGFTPPPADPRAANREACSELAEIWCASHALCLKATFASDYGDKTECVARQTTQCERTRFAPGTTTTHDHVRRCAADSDLSDRPANEHCIEWLRREVGRDPPSSCRVEGTRQGGEQCLVDGQCDEGTCSPIVVCGLCRAPSKLGQPCLVDAQCVPGSACANGACALYGDAGAECDGARPCLPHLACLPTASVDRCAERLPEGASCVPMQAACALWPAELVCNPELDRCEPYEPRPLGAECGLLPDGTAARCEHGSVCFTVSPKGTCEAVVEDGKYCAYAVGAGNFGAYFQGGPCRAPAICHQNRCQILDAAACGAAAP
jgi:hypothetical protein